MKAFKRLFNYNGYELLDPSVSTRDKSVVLLLERKPGKEFTCCRCGCQLGTTRGRHRITMKELTMMGFRTEVRFWRYKGYCDNCRKVRSEYIDFISTGSSHISKAYAEWVGTMCEFAAVSRVAGFTNEAESTVRRIDYRRMQDFLKTYEIPDVSRISVDEVYARRKSKFKGESRDKKFFTVISDLDTRRVIWVTESRDKAALDEFFKILGEERARKIRLVAMDQHDPYKASVKEYCPKAKVVWDRFHIMQSFNEALNEVRKTLHAELSPKDPLFRMTMGKYRYLFLKKPTRRSQEEQSHIDQVYLENSKFLQLELIQERVYSFFDQHSVIAAEDVFIEIGRWISQHGYDPLKKWYRRLKQNWNVVKNYFTDKITSALSEGINNVIKTLKRRAYGYRNMDYFRLKIMQVCGYLNSEWAGRSLIT